MDAWIGWKGFGKVAYIIMTLVWLRVLREYRAMRRGGMHIRRRQMRRIKLTRSALLLLFLPMLNGGKGD